MLRCLGDLRRCHIEDGAHRDLDDRDHIEGHRIDPSGGESPAVDEGHHEEVHTPRQRDAHRAQRIECRIAIEATAHLGRYVAGVVAKAQRGDLPEVDTAGKHTHAEAPDEAPHHRREVDVAEGIEQVGCELEYTQEYLLDALRYRDAHQLIGVELKDRPAHREERQRYHSIVEVREQWASVAVERHQRALGEDIEERHQHGTDRPDDRHVVEEAVVRPVLSAVGVGLGVAEEWEVATE